MPLSSLLPSVLRKEKPKQKQKGISFGYCDTATGQRVYPASDPPDLVAAPEASVDLRGMYAKIVCSPPLGQVTVVSSDAESVQFTVLVEANVAPEERYWEVALWHNYDGLDYWQAYSLQEISETSSLLVVNAKDRPNVVRRWFSTTLPRRPKHPSPVSFTIKFRTGTDDGWKWVHDQSGIADGQLYYQRTTVLGNHANDLSYYIRNLGSQLTVSPEAPETPDTLLWSVTAPVKAAAGTTSGYSGHTLGTPVDYTRWFSLVRLWSPWLAPRHGKHQFRADKDAVLAAFLRHDGLHVVILAVSGVDDVLTVLNHDEKGNIRISGRNDSEEGGISRVLVAISKSFDVANAAVMYHARKLVSRYETTTGEQQQELKTLMDKNVKVEWLEDWYDGLTYCTWNGLGQSLTEDKIYDALDSLERNNITITNLIIDDNWQSLAEGENQFRRGWLEFEANKKGFPRGLKQAVADIRNKHESIVHIAVWHAMLGYWGGISPDGAIAKEYKTTHVRKKDGVAGGSMLVVDADDAPRMYDDFYRFLSSVGVDAVKTDAQFFLDELDDAPDRRRFIKTYQDAWTISQLRHFSAKAISCMSQTPQILFHSQLPTNKPRLLVRNSDDFFPEVPASHPWHIFCNAHNSLLTQHLNVLPDWDMFQTAHPWAAFHAAARCVSGGPIYFTDAPGAHDIDLIHQMTAKTPRGNTVILRPHTVGKTTQIYTGYDELNLLKVATYVGMAHSGTSILGVFNTTPSPLTELVRLTDFPGTETGTYVIRAHSTGEVSAPMTRTDKAAFVCVDTKVQGWEILAAHPLRAFELKRKHEGNGSTDVVVANLGLLGKMTGAAAVVNSDVYVEETGRLRVWTSLKALGTLGIYISDLPNRSLEADLMALVFGKPVPLHVVQRSATSPNVLEIDVAQAWQESDQKAG
ncbi:hypothetical protein LTR04_001128, partial [Oleoguttula sp. CCFEE 6159]